MKKMNYNQVLMAATLLAALPLDVKVKDKEAGEYTRSLDSALTGRVLSLMANLNVLAKTYSDLEDQARNGAVPQDFRNRYAEYAEKVEKKEIPVDPEIEKEAKDYDAKFFAAVKELRDQAVELKPALFTSEEFEKISEHTQGAEIRIQGKEVSRLHWLVDFSQILVEG